MDSEILLDIFCNSIFKEIPCVQACINLWPLRDRESATLYTWILDYYWTFIMMHMIDIQILLQIFKIEKQSLCASMCLCWPVTPARPCVGHAAYIDSWQILNIHNSMCASLY